MALTTGTKAPDFTLKSSQDGQFLDVTLSAFQGQKVVLLFFPGAFTGVCTQEFCDVSSGLDAYDDLNIMVFGISCDTAYAQAAWAEAKSITVPLLSDYARTVTQAYDVVLENLSGMGPSSQRAVYLIDEAGIIQYVEVTANPGVLPKYEALKAAVSATVPA